MCAMPILVFPPWWRQERGCGGTLRAAKAQRSSATSCGLRSAYTLHCGGHCQGRTAAGVVGVRRRLEHASSAALPEVVVGVVEDRRVQDPVERGGQCCAVPRRI